MKSYGWYAKMPPNIPQHSCLLFQLFPDYGKIHRLYPSTGRNKGSQNILPFLSYRLTDKPEYMKGAVLAHYGTAPLFKGLCRFNTANYKLQSSCVLRT